MKFIKFFAILAFNIIDKFFHQKKILLFLKKNQIKVNNFVDVGSHKGTYTDLILNNFKAEKILMFEPQKKIFKIIKKKYKKFNFIKIFNYAISDKNKYEKIFINRHDLTSSLKKINESNNYLKKKRKLFSSKSGQGLIEKIYKVKTIRLRDILSQKNFKKIDLLKVDTEGHELEVLIGLGNFIKNTGCILIEFHRDKIYYNYSPKKIHRYLIKNKFILKKTFRFPFTYWEDRMYVNNNTK